jgi:putative transposase
LKKALAPTSKREAVDYFVGEEHIPISAACSAVGLSRASYYKKPQELSEKYQPVLDALN